MKNKKKQKERRLFFVAVSTLIGTIIGAGILGIPYVVAQSGFFVGLLHIILLGLIMLLVNLYLGEIALRTPGTRQQLTGYAQTYLGKFGKLLMAFSMIFGIYGALTAYIVGEGEVLSFVFTTTLTHKLLFCIIFWMLMSCLVVFEIKMLGRGEAVGIIGEFGVLIAIMTFFIPKIKVTNLAYLATKPSLLFLPYGVVLFSFLAFSALPELEQELKQNVRIMKKAIITGSIIPIAIYALFALAVVGYAGNATPQVATIALGRLPSAFAIFSMFTAFFALAYALRTMYEYDFKMSKIKSWILTTVVPIGLAVIIIIWKLATFTQILSVTGSVTGGLTGILILLINKKAKKIGKRKPEYSIKINWFLIIFIAAIFVAGIVFDLWRFYGKFFG